MCANVFQTFWPLTTHSSPSRTARVASDARSEPAPGSLKSWHQTSSPVKSGRSSARARLGLRVLHDRGRGQEQAESVPAGLVVLDALAAQPALDEPLERGIGTEPAEAHREVHPREPQVVLRAPELDPVPGVVVLDELVRERFHRCLIRHDAGA